MRSYPIAYRGGRSPQRARLFPPSEPPLGFGPYAALGAMAWAFGQLAIQMQGWSPPMIPGGALYPQSPSAYGWTLTRDCGRPQLRLPAAAHINCNLQVVGKAAWETSSSGTNTPMNPTTTNLYYWATAGTIYNANLQRYEQCPPAAHWTRGLGTRFAPLTYAPARPFPGVPSRLPVLWARVLEIFGLRDRGYAARGEVVLTLPGHQRPPLGVDIVYPPAVIPTPTVRYSDATETVARARAVPVSMTREIKMQPNTAAGRMWMGVYASLNFLGAAWGLTRALHRAIPRANRRRSKRLGSMLQDIYNYAGVLNTLTQRERDAYLMASGAYMAMWTANRWAYGKAGAGLFTTQSMGAGGEALARSWATFDTAARSSQYRLRQTADRRQTDVRW